MYVRLAFAVAAHLDPELLLVDEVLAVGDASFQQKCLAKMQDVAGHGRTVLFISHNMTAVQALCGRVICLVDGRVNGNGVPNKVIQDYLLTNSAKRDQPSIIKVGDGLTIDDISFLPNPVETGGDLKFALTVQAHISVRLNEIVILLYALQGPRVGIMDLRDAGFPFMMKFGDCLRIEGLLRAVPLVENRYHVGLYINSGAFVGDVTEVADLIVYPAFRHASYTQYRPEVRGWVEFAIECSSHLVKADAVHRSTPTLNRFKKEERIAD
jgi:hypothetical protein